MSDASEARELLNRLRASIPATEAATRTYVSELELRVERIASQAEATEAELSEYRTAYETLTAPANRTGCFLQWLGEEAEGLCLVAVGDTEYVALVDPLLDRASLTCGATVRLNEALAVVGHVPSRRDGAIAKVAECLEGGMLRIGAESPGSGGRTVLRSDALIDTAIEPGDEVRLDQTGRIAVETFSRNESRDFFFEEVPETPWTAVGGQDEAIQVIRDTIETPLLHPELYRKYRKKAPKGILLYGPPGCGKTLIGKAIAHNVSKEYAKIVGHEVKEYFMMISGPKILNMWLGETERLVREIFKTAREKAKQGRIVFIFMDEAESLLRTRSSGRWLNISNTVVPQFCAELDGLVQLDNVVLILTSNRPDYIDPAILRPERIDRKIKVRRPNREASTQILGIYLGEDLPFDPELLASFHGDVDCVRRELCEGLIEALWSQSDKTSFLRISLRNGTSETLHWRDLVSGALLKSVVERTKDLALRRQLSEPSVPTGITAEDLHQALTAEYAENEIFPRSDAAEDWLKLLDYEPGQVVSVSPVGSAVPNTAKIRVQ